MKIFNMERGSGKTTLLIIISHFTNARIITTSNQTAKYTKVLAQKMNFSIPEPKSWLDYTHGSFNRGRREKILIDDLDSILRMLFGQEIMAITINDKEIL